MLAWFILLLISHSRNQFRSDCSCLLNTNRAVVGRGGETKSLRWDQAQYNPADNVLDALFFEEKTGTFANMTFCNDKCDWRCDVFVSMAAFLIVSAEAMDPTATATHYMFPFLQKIQNESVSKKVTAMIKKVQPCVQGLHESATSHDIRYVAVVAVCGLQPSLF